MHQEVDEVKFQKVDSFFKFLRAIVNGPSVMEEEILSRIKAVNNLRRWREEFRPTIALQNGFNGIWRARKKSRREIYR